MSLYWPLQRNVFIKVVFWAKKKQTNTSEFFLRKKNSRHVINSKKNLKKVIEKSGQNFDQNDNKYTLERILIYVITKITTLKWKDHHKTKKNPTEYFNRNI